MIVVSFKLTMGEAVGLMNLCIPYATIEPIMGEFSTHNWFAAARRPNQETNLTQITRSLAEADLEVVADLAVTQITVRELLELEVGDLVISSRHERSATLASLTEWKQTRSLSGLREKLSRRVYRYYVPRKRQESAYSQLYS